MGAARDDLAAALDEVVGHPGEEVVDRGGDRIRVDAVEGELDPVPAVVVLGIGADVDAAVAGGDGGERVGDLDLVDREEQLLEMERALAAQPVA